MKGESAVSLRSETRRPEPDETRQHRSESERRHERCASVGLPLVESAPEVRGREYPGGHEMYERLFIAAVAVLMSSACLGGSTNETVAEQAIREDYTYGKDTVLQEAERVFGVGTAELGRIIERVFETYGRPTGFIAGEEAGGAIAVGLRYGHGKLKLRRGDERDLYWQGPSIGFDVGGNASKVFALVYNITDPESVYQRYPGVDGSLYFVGGFGLNYHQRGDVVIAPIRLGVGWRQGANIGYIRVTRTASILPF